jgi:hypothetical protein
MLTAPTVPAALPRRRTERRHPAKAVLTHLATAARFAGHFAVAAVSVAVVGTDGTEH